MSLTLEKKIRELSSSGLYEAVSSVREIFVEFMAKYTLQKHYVMSRDKTKENTRIKEALYSVEGALQWKPL